MKSAKFFGGIGRLRFPQYFRKIFPTFAINFTFLQRLSHLFVFGNKRTRIHYGKRRPEISFWIEMTGNK